MRRGALVLISAALIFAPTASFAQPDWCWNLDYFTSSAADAMITIAHHSALYNCCPDHIEYSAALEGNRISVVETEVLVTPCACLCCYDLSVQIGPYSPGHYEIDFAWQDYETGPRHEFFSVEVPGSALRASAAEGIFLLDPPLCIHEKPAEIGPIPRASRGSSETGRVPILSAGAPNPARSAVTLWYELAQSGRIGLAVFSAGGARVRTLSEGPAQAGRHQVVWDLKDEAGRTVPAGAYFCRLQGEAGAAERRLIIIR